MIKTSFIDVFRLPKQNNYAIIKGWENIKHNGFINCEPVFLCQEKYRKGLWCWVIFGVHEREWSRVHLFNKFASFRELLFGIDCCDFHLTLDLIISWWKFFRLWYYVHLYKVTFNFEQLHKIRSINSFKLIHDLLLTSIYWSPASHVKRFTCSKFLWNPSLLHMSNGSQQQHHSFKLQSLFPS